MVPDLSSLGMVGTIPQGLGFSFLLQLLITFEQLSLLNCLILKHKSHYLGSLSTVVGDEKLTSRENLIGFLFLYVQSDENTLPKVNKVSKTEAQTFDVFDKLIGPLQFCI